jgi:hypothetical protein
MTTNHIIHERAEAETVRALFLSPSGEGSGFNDRSWHFATHSNTLNLRPLWPPQHQT